MFCKQYERHTFLQSLASRNSNSPSLKALTNISLTDKTEDSVPCKNKCRKYGIEVEDSWCYTSEGNHNQTCHGKHFYDFRICNPKLN